jgi:glycosyltransferase involved in cell wall biosynthesis
MQNTTQLRVLHISTGHAGGAGLASRRLNYSLNKRGIKSGFLAIENCGYLQADDEYSFVRSKFQQILSKFSTVLQKNLSRTSFFTLFSINLLTERKLKQIGVSKDTVLHFHNIFNFTNFKFISKLVRNDYRVVVTLHDQRFMTGGCHYAYSCVNFKSNCFSCPQLGWSSKFLTFINLMINHRRYVNLEQKIIFIAPSQWILNEAKKAKLLKNQKVIFIPNSLGNFRVDNKLPHDFKKMQNSENSNLTLGIASMDKNSYIKGSRIVKELIEYLKSSNDSIKIVFLKDIISQYKSADVFWNIIDCLAVFSLAENSPNVIHEAKFLGIPIIATKVGGITELLKPGFDVALDLENLNSKFIVEQLKSMKIGKLNKSDIVMMKSSFDLYTMTAINKHLEIYNL